jgi:hypothetical protein
MAIFFRKNLYEEWLVSDMEKGLAIKGIIKVFLWMSRAKGPAWSPCTGKPETP